MEEITELRGHMHTLPLLLPNNFLCFFLVISSKNDYFLRGGDVLVFLGSEGRGSGFEEMRFEGVLDLAQVDRGDGV